MSTNDPYQPERTTIHPAPQRSWVVPVLVTAVAFLTAGLVFAAGYVLLSSEPDSVIGDEASGYEQAQSLMEATWAQQTPTEQAEICDDWNLGLEDIFLDSFMEGAGDSATDLGITDTELRTVVADFMNGEC